MTKGSALRCSRYGCARTTLDASGRCHDHRSTSDSWTGPDLPPPPPLTPIYEIPSRIVHENGTYEDEYRDHDGALHRPDAPAIIAHYPDGTVKRETYYRRSEIHRLDGPAVLDFYEDGSPRELAYRQAGRLHRLDGPAVVEYTRSGEVRGEQWYRGGWRHRIDGPSQVSYSSVGPHRREVFAFLGEECRDLDELTEKIRGSRPAVIDVVLRDSPYAKAYSEGLPIEAILRAITAEVHTSEGARALHEGAPMEWVRSFEETSKN